jgi:hypothetical protein
MALSITLRQVFERVRHLEVSLVAGQAGLDREVVWTHMVDSAAISSFQQGRELVLTTGLGLDADFSLLELVQKVYHNGASGILVNVGHYIDDIGPEVKRFADDHDFPVFEVPWRIRMAEIERIVCFDIMQEKQDRMELDNALACACFSPEHEELYLPLLKSRGYAPDGVCLAAVLRIYDRGKGIPLDRLDHFCAVLNSSFRFSGRKVLCTTQEKQMLLVLEPADEKAACGLMNKFFDDLCARLAPAETALLCIGQPVRGLRSMSRSYQTACRLADIALSGSLPGEEACGRHRLVCFKEAGPYRLLLGVEDRETLRSYLEDTVLPLVDYDALHQTDLCSILQCYLDHDCSLQKTADELYMHRNTVHYKISKISDILSLDLTSLENRIQVSLGLASYRILRASGA